MVKLNQAQGIIFDAWGTPDRNKRIELARKALTVSPLCADAYVLLAEAATTASEKLRYYEDGVKAGEKALGEDFLEIEAGSFWGRLETRPYMRARAGLAASLWEVGRQQEAIDHLRDLLKLKPRDNQGNRFILAQYLLTLDDVAAVKALLEKYPDDASTTWSYARTLLAYHDKAPDADNIAREAWKSNHYVPGMLSGARPPVESANGALSMGGPDEATHYMKMFGAVWRAAPGAIEWLSAVTKDLSPPKRFAGTFH